MPPRGTPREAHGCFAGESVVNDPDPGTRLEDLVEEMGMAIAYRGDRRLLERRKIRQRSDLEEPETTRFSELRHDLPDLPGGAALSRLIIGLQALESRADEDGSEDRPSCLRNDVLAELEAYDPDVAHQYAGLEMALRHFEQVESGQRFLDVLRSLQADYAQGALLRDVRAGFAAALPASQTAATLGKDASEIRSAYRMMIAEARNAAELFQLLRMFDLAGRLEAVIATFTKVAARDLASTGPSTDRNFIRSLIVELNRLSKAKSVVLMVRDLMETASAHLLEGEMPAGDELDVAGRVLAFACTSAAEAHDARIMLEPYERTSLAAQLVFANGLRALHAELPADVAPTAQAHLRQSTAILHMLQALVRDEENQFQSA